MVVDVPMIAEVMLASVATREAMNPLVVVLFVVEALVTTRLVVVALIAVTLVVEAVVRYALVAVIVVQDEGVKVGGPDGGRRVAVVVARVEVPVTPRVPAIVALPVTVEVPIVALVMRALVVVELVTVSPAIVASVEKRFCTKPVVVVALPDTRPTKSPFVAENVLVKKFVELLFSAVRF